MTDSNEPWARLGKYFVTMTDLTVGYVKDVANVWAGALNTDTEKGTGDTVLSTMRESFGVGIRTTAKAWVETRQLMVDLAE